MAKRYITPTDIGAAPSSLVGRVTDLENGNRRKAIVLANAPNPDVISEYIELATGRHRFHNGTSWQDVSQRVAEGSLDGNSGLQHYPDGVSCIAALGTDPGWPTSENYNCLTLKPTSTKGSQIACLGAGTRTYVRRWNNSLSAWGGWEEKT
jgi:hypothetical protein